jgi:hypothetical protein
LPQAPSPQTTSFLCSILLSFDPHKGIIIKKKKKKKKKRVEKEKEK